MAIFIIRLIVCGGNDGASVDPSCLQVHQGMLLQTPFAHSCLTTFETILLGLVAITIALYLLAKIALFMTSLMLTKIGYGRFQNNNLATLIQDEF